MVVHMESIKGESTVMIAVRGRKLAGTKYVLVVDKWRF